MEILIILALTAIVFFIWQGFRTRCPKCGKMALHPKDKDAEEVQKQHYENLKKTSLLSKLDESGVTFGSERAKSGYANALFKCKNCGWLFGRREAITWLTTANKVGENVALREYEKLKRENT
ncbi:hypothetical protein P4S54_07680 [Shewanella sp. PP-He15 brown]